MKRQTILLDLDGTLLDVRGRYEAVHRATANAFGFEPVPFARYWRAKRRGRTEAAMLRQASALTEESIMEALRYRQALLERSDFLRLDVLWPWTLQCLESLAADRRLVLITLRTRAEDLEHQLSSLGIAQLLSDIVCRRGRNEFATKAELLQSSSIAPDASRLLVGDTEEDITAGVHLGVATLALSCGLRTASLLSAARPTFLARDLRSTPETLRKLDARSARLPHSR